MAAKEVEGQPVGDDRPELLVKLQERKERHKQRSLPLRIATVIFGCLIVLLGVIMAGPGVPGPGIAVIRVGLGVLALEFDRAARLRERVIVWADRAADRAEAAPLWQKVLTGALATLAGAGFIVAAILWDIPLVPV